MKCAFPNLLRHWLALLLATLAALAAVPARAGQIDVPPEAQKALDAIYSGDTQQGAALARAFQQAQPQNPVGYLIEGEALWWARYCEACEIRYGMVEAWRHNKERADEAYLALADKAIALAQTHLAKSDTPEMHFYAGMGFGLKVRMYGLRGENRAAAKAGVAARAQMLDALQLDPQMADATAAMGIYNYYVDTLSPILKILRFFMGIPGGDKQEGVRQMEDGMNRGNLLAVDVRFILARALRQYDRQYQQALSIAQPLVARYPRNPMFLLLVGNLHEELGGNARAQEYFRTAEQLPAASASACLAHARDLARSFSTSVP
jgi:tetratricopeptide (TPR) repeat protein